MTEQEIEYYGIYRVNAKVESPEGKILLWNYAVLSSSEEKAIVAAERS